MTRSSPRSLPIVAALAAGLLGGCTWVEPTDAGAAVRVASLEDVQACRRIGQTSTTTLDSVGPVARGRLTVQHELETLARNEAATMGGDTIVPVTVSTEGGAAAYAVFVCAEPGAAG